MPDTFVAIGLNSPRNSAGAVGLRSHMSWCDGPPLKWTLMIALLELRTPAGASAPNTSASVRPPIVIAPNCRNERRETPSQYPDFEPKRMLSMARLLELVEVGVSWRAGVATGATRS